jgi:hypothetical protein
MTQADLDTRKSSVNKCVQINTVDGEQLVARVISVFAGESDADMFFELISTSHPDLYSKVGNVGGYSLPLKDVVSVLPAQ